MANPQKDPDKGGRKFFFDLHNFDAPETKDDAPPPPPSFNQDELEAAKTLAFEQGRQKGLNEANASREQKVAMLLQQVATQFATLFAAEQERESRYEEEAILLTLRSLEKIFPAMNERMGPYEAEQAIRKVLKTAADQSEITVRIHPDFTGDIEALIAPFRNKDVNPPNFHIIADDTLGPGDCRLSWADGGAMRDAGQLARAVMNALMDLLPERALEIATPEGTDSKNNDINEEIAAESTPDDSPDGAPGETHE